MNNTVERNGNLNRRRRTNWDSLIRYWLQERRNFILLITALSMLGQSLWVLLMGQGGNDKISRIVPFISGDNPALEFLTFLQVVCLATLMFFAIPLLLIKTQKQLFDQGQARFWSALPLSRRGYLWRQILVDLFTLILPLVINFLLMSLLLRINLEQELIALYLPTFLKFLIAIVTTYLFGRLIFQLSGRVSDAVLVWGILHFAWPALILFGQRSLYMLKPDFDFGPYGDLMGKIATWAPGLQLYAFPRGGTLFAVAIVLVLSILALTPVEGRRPFEISEKALIEMRRAWVPELIVVFLMAMFTGSQIASLTQNGHRISAWLYLLGAIPGALIGQVIMDLSFGGKAAESKKRLASVIPVILSLAGIILLWGGF